MSGDKPSGEKYMRMALEEAKKAVAGMN